MIYLLNIYIIIIISMYEKHGRYLLGKYTYYIANTEYSLIIITYILSGGKRLECSIAGVYLRCIIIVCTIIYRYYLTDE